MEKSKTIFENSKQFMVGKKRSLFLILLIPIAAFLLEMLVRLPAVFLTESNVALGIILMLVGFCVVVARMIIDATVPFALIKYIDTAHQGTLLSPINSYKIGWKRLFKGAILILTKAFIVVVGLIAFIIPGVYFAFSLACSNYAYMVNKKGIKSSLVYSTHIMQNNFKQLILKQLYISWRAIIVMLGGVVSLAVLFAAGVASTKEMLFIPVAILGLAGTIFFLIKSINIIFIAQEYMYEVFKNIEKSKGEIKEEDLLNSEKKLMKWLKISIIFAAFVGIIAFTVISAQLK